MRTILSMLMIAAVVAGFAFFIVPRYQAITALRVQAADYNQILDNAKTLQAERNRLLAKFNAFDPADIAKLNVMLPTNPENMKLILALDEVAYNSGISFQNVKIENATGSETATRPGQATQSADVGILNITFSMSGPYNGFVSFLRALETSLRIIDVQKISFTASDTGANYQYTVGIKTYWVK